jgi:hypothetical protein
LYKLLKCRSMPAMAAMLSGGKESVRLSKSAALSYFDLVSA